MQHEYVKLNECLYNAKTNADPTDKGRTTHDPVYAPLEELARDILQTPLSKEALNEFINTIKGQ
jgi:hypothetical protein